MAPAAGRVFEVRALALVRNKELLIINQSFISPSYTSDLSFSRYKLMIYMVNFGLY